MKPSCFEIAYKKASPYLQDYFEQDYEKIRKKRKRSKAILPAGKVAEPSAEASLAIVVK